MLINKHGDDDDDDDDDGGDGDLCRCHHYEAFILHILHCEHSSFRTITTAFRFRLTGQFLSRVAPN